MICEPKIDCEKDGHCYIYTHDENVHHTVYHYQVQDCPYCEIDRLRENIKHEIDVDQARINVEMENKSLRKALELIASYDCSWYKESGLCDCESCIAREALQRAGGGE